MTPVAVAIQVGVGIQAEVEGGIRVEVEIDQRDGLIEDITGRKAGQTIGIIGTIGGAQR